MPGRSGRKLTQEEFEEKVYSFVRDEYTFLEKYKGNDIKIKVRHNCKKCNNYEYLVSPHNFFRGHKCLKCSGKLKKTNEEFIKEVYNQVKNEYTFLENYINTDTKILCKHNKCEYEWKISPYKFLNRQQRCPKCASPRYTPIR